MSSPAILNEEPAFAAMAAETDLEISRPAPERGEFDYKPVPVYAPVAGIIAVVSATAVISELMVLAALGGIVLGAFAMIRIRRAKGALGGKAWARLGLFGSAGCFVLGVATHTFAYMTEVPEGHERVNFSREISAKQFVYVNGSRELHPDVVPLDGKKVFIKGYMWNTQKQTGLADFVFLKDNGKCCFGGAPKPYDMMIVKMQNGKTVDKIEGLVAVAGTLKCYPQSPEAVYVLEATWVARARTSH